MSYLVSIDPGNSSIKTVVEGTQFLQYPTIYFDVASKVDYRLNPSLSSSKSNGRNLLDVSVITNSGKENKSQKDIAFGLFVEKFPGKGRNRDFTEKSTDDLLLRQIITTTAFSIINYKLEKKEKLSKETTIHVTLSAGLPYKEYAEGNGTETRDMIFKRNLEGSHRVVFNNPYFLKEFGLESVELIIDEAIVFVEGNAALEAITRSNSTELDTMEPSALLNKAFVLVDIGAGTTEFITFLFQQVSEEDEELEVEPVIQPHLCKGYPRGIGHIQDASIINIKANHPELKDDIVRRDIERAYTTPGGKRNGEYGWLAGKDINVNPEVLPLASSFGEELGRTFYGFYNESGIKTNIMKIFLCGGGSRFDNLADNFKDVLGNNDFNKELISSVSNPDPVFANAFGYYLFLIDIMNSRAEADE